MSRRSWVPELPLLAALLFASFGPVAASAVAAAPEVTFDQPTATATLGGSTSFTIGFTSATPPGRVELLRHGPRDEGDLVSVAEVSDAGNGRYTATVVDRGHTLPNTTFLYRFRVTTTVGPAVSDEQRFTVSDQRFQWRVREGALIRLHWYQGDDAFADRALKVGDEGLAKATALLGVTETEPVDFFIYADESSFREAMGPGTRENVGGRAVPSIRTLFALIRPSEIGSSWIDSVIPHELTHLVFGTASDNPYHFPPKWLNEGLAVYLEPGGYSADWRARVELAGRSSTLIPLDGLALQFPADRDGFFLGYAESVAAVDFFVRRYGQETLVKLIRSYAAGVSDDDAFRSATGADLAAFSAAWIADMRGGAAAAVGPRPAPPGPLPSDWTAPSVTSQPSAKPPPSITTQPATPPPPATTQPPRVSSSAASIAPALPSATSAGSPPGSASAAVV
ncbi:MAG: hypothetical protein H0W07_10650, partial [Chloroflexi bacterium]|nr:hypothetical protein [Chloroflexota bacterium]